MSNRKLPKIIGYDVCVKVGSVHYAVGRFFVRVYKGELMFIPKQKFLRKDKTAPGEEVDHFMWHASGQYHIKKKTGDYDIQQSSKGALPIKEIGFQPLINIYIKDPTQLATKDKLEPLDVVLDIGTFNGNIGLEISLLSGRWMLANKPEIGFGFVTSDPFFPGLMVKDRRFIGQHSDNADKIIQFSASKVDFPDKDPNLAVNVMLSTFANQNISR